MPSHYVNRDHNPNEDPISRTNDKWYSLTDDLTGMDGLYSYCTYCLENFRTFHSMVNQVCSSCGRVAGPIMKPKQQSLDISSINDNNAANVNMQATSMKIDYLENDVNMQEKFPIGERLQAIGLGQAMKKLEMAERSTSAAYRARMAALNERSYMVKTTTSARERNNPLD